MASLAKLSLLGVAIAVAAYLALPPQAAFLYAAQALDSPNETMRAVCYTEHGDSSKLKVVEDYPMPQPRAGQILVKVHFSSLNPSDYKLRRNPLPGFISWLLVPKPKIPGDDIAGTVVAVGSAVPSSQFQVGDRVAAMMEIIGTKWGAGAQYAAVDASAAARVPDVVPLDEAAAMPLVSLTALTAFSKLRGPLQNKSILIQAGAGGVGSFAIQWAKHALGMRVIATCSSANVGFLQSLGADQVVDYSAQNFVEVLSDLDAVLDPLSYKYERQTFEAGILTSVGGHYLNVLSSDFGLGANGWDSFGNGLDTAVRFVSAKARRLFDAGAQDYDLIAVSPDGARLRTVLDQMASGKIRAVVDKKFPLERAAEAYDLLQEGHTRGKILLEVSH